MSYFSKSCAMVWCLATRLRKWSKFFVEFVASTRNIDDENFARLIRQIKESVRNLRRQVRKTAFLTFEGLLADLDLESPIQNVERFFLFVVNMQRRTASWRDFHDGIVEGTASIVAGYLKNEYPGWGLTGASNLRLQLRLCPEAVVKIRGTRLNQCGGGHEILPVHGAMSGQKLLEHSSLAGGR